MNLPQCMSVEKNDSPKVKWGNQVDLNLVRETRNFWTRSPSIENVNISPKNEMKITLRYEKRFVTRLVEKFIIDACMCGRT